MSVTYGEILRNAALRLGEAGSIIGTTTAEIEANFQAASFDAGEIDNPAFPYAAQVDALLMAEQKIASVVAEVKNHPLRVFLRSISDNLPNRAVLPFEDNGGEPVVGVLGAVRDATNNTLLTRVGSASDVERINRLKTAGQIKSEIYRFTTDGATLLHTRTNVIAEMCIYNRTTQKAAILANSPMLFPDTLHETLVCGELSFLFRYDEAPETIKYYLDFFADSIKRLESGGLPESNR